MSSTMTIRLDDTLKQRLELLSKSTKRSKSFLAAEAVREFVELNEWQVAETHKALNEASRGDFASEQDIQDIKNKWS